MYEENTHIPLIVAGKEVAEKGGAYPYPVSHIDIVPTVLDYFGGFQPLRCIFDGRYKLAVNLLSSDELYDLEKDPQEMENLIEKEEYAKIRDRLHDKLLDWMDETRDPMRGYCFR